MNDELQETGMQQVAPSVDGAKLQMRDFDKKDLPREKLLLQGRAALTDEELIALFLRTGLHGCNVLELAGMLKRCAGSLSALGRMEAAEIANCCKGIGPAKAATLAAVFELGQRAVKESLSSADMGDASRVYEYLACDLHLESDEMMVVLLLTSRRKLIRRFTIGRGTLTRVLSHPRAVFRPAMIYNAACIVIAHNHPGGDPSPSRQDIELTTAIAKAGELLCIPLLDHVIIGDASSPHGPYYSFHEHHMIPRSK